MTIDLRHIAPALALGVAAPAHADTVTIARDGFGVPHVTGETSAAVMFGAGYAIAHDRLAAMELDRRGAAGRRAEIQGKAAIEADQVARDYALPDAELMRMYRTLDTEHQRMIQAFVDGINRAIDEVNADPEHKLPLEFVRWGIRPTRWKLTEYLAYLASLPHGRDTFELRNLAFLEAMVARYGRERGWQIFNDVVPISDPDSPTAIPAGEDLAPARPIPAPVLAPVQFDAGAARTTAAADTRILRTDLPKEASRCMVIGPRKSADGHVLMLQATADGPEMHLKGGGFDTAGFGFDSQGESVMGRGVQHGWLVVSGSAEASTVFAERLNPANRFEYWYRGAWKAMDHHVETIKVRDGTPVTHEVAWTVHGPVISWNATRGLAYSYQMAQRGRELDSWVGILELGRAKSLDDFVHKGVDRIAWNLGVCYGGEDGHIAYYEAGVLPKKAPGVDPRLPTPGTGEYEWTGYLTPAEKPHVVDPKQGYLFAWNSKATTWSQEGNSARIGAAFRTWLGNRLAASGQGLTLLDMREFNRRMFNAYGAVDRTQTSPDFFAPFITRAVAASDDPEVKRAGALMLGWNGLYEDRDLDQTYDNPGATLFRAWLEIAPRMIFADDIGDWWKTIDDGRYLRYQTSLLLRAFQGPAAGAPLRFDYFNGQDRTAMMIATIKATVADVARRFPGQDMAAWKMPIFWKYYDAPRPDPAHPALSEGAPLHRLWAIEHLGPAMAPHNGGEGWVGLMDIDPAHRALYSVVERGGQDQFIDARGQGNPHLIDQVAMHEANELKKIPLGHDEVQAATQSTETLTYTP
jgi:penicillin G amidase